MKKIIITLIIICLFLIAGCEGDIWTFYNSESGASASEASSTDSSTSQSNTATENVFFTTGGDAILIDNTIGNYYASVDDSVTVKTGSRDAGKGFFINGSEISVSSGAVSVSGTTVSSGGSIYADVYETSTKTYYAFTYDSKDYLTRVGIPISSDAEMTSLALEWEDVSEEQLYLNNAENNDATSVYYAEDSQENPYYVIVGL